MIEPVGINNRHTMGRIFTISGPSGTGKSTIISRLLELRPELVLSVSATTRAPREGETDGVSYYFIPRNLFLEMIDRNEFLEYAEYVGEYYGTPEKPVLENLNRGKDVILEIEVQGTKQVIEKYKTESVPQVVTIFITPPDILELERRLRNRGAESEEKLAARLERSRQEFSEITNYEHVVVNEDLCLAVEKILSIIDMGG